MKRILCVIDLTSSSQNVLEVATSLTNEKEAYLTILFTYRLIAYGYKGDVTKLKAKLEQDARNKFSHIKNQIRSMDHLSYEFQPEVGFTVDRINFHIERTTPDVIVISQLQLNDIDEVSKTALLNLVTKAKISIITVP